MSNLAETAKYKLVLFDRKRKMLPGPYYSFAAYEKKGRSIITLEERIIKKKKHYYAILYNNQTGQIIRKYTNGIKDKEIDSEIVKTEKSKLKIWIATDTGNITFYSNSRIDTLGEEESYWTLINCHVRGKNSKSVQRARIYRTETDELIGDFKREGYHLYGKGNYHKKQLQQ